MTLFQWGVYVGLVLAVLFLLSGLSILLFGKKTQDPKTKSQRLEFNIGGQSMSMPYNVNIAICGVGVLLLFLTFDLIKQSGVEGGNNGIGGIELIGSAYAQPDGDPNVVPGWVYFGYEKNPQLWNFEILNGEYSDLLNKSEGLLLRSNKTINIRKNHFGNFTGTFLGFLSPPPPIIGTLPQGHCIAVKDVTSVGFSKIWIDAIPMQCPN